MEQHQAKNTESWGLQRFGAFWLDYVYTMEVKEEKAGKFEIVQVLVDGACLQLTFLFD